jgi:hypothetical protein
MTEIRILIIGSLPMIGTEDAVHGYFAHEIFHVTQLELERQARRQRLVGFAVRARFRSGKAAREARVLRLASDAVGAVGEPSPNSRSAVRAAR